MAAIEKDPCLLDDIQDLELETEFLLNLLKKHISTSQFFQINETQYLKNDHNLTPSQQSVVIVKRVAIKQLSSDFIF